MKSVMKSAVTETLNLRINADLRAARESAECDPKRISTTSRLLCRPTAASLPAQESYAYMAQQLKKRVELKKIWSW